MKLIKLALISAVLLFGVVLVISLFIPSHIRISRATEISAPADTVRSYLVNPVKWQLWYPNLEATELITQDGVVTGVSSGADATGRTLVIDRVRHDQVTTLYTANGRRVASGWNIHANAFPVTVQWYMDFELQWYPWEKFASLLFEKNYGSMMENGLAALKKQLENRPDPEAP